jgi:uncharacterized protein
MNKYLSPERIRLALANLPQLVFEVTDACNLQCKYCGYGEFYDDYDSREYKNITDGAVYYLQHTYFLQKKLAEMKNSYIFEGKFDR